MMNEVSLEFLHKTTKEKNIVSSRILLCEAVNC